MSYGEDGSDGTRAVPSYIAAEAETVPIPKIVVPRPPAPPPKQSLWQRLGDLPMRVIYRFAAGAAAVVVLAAGGVTYWVTRDDEGPTSAVAAPGTTPTATTAPASPSPSSVSALGPGEATPESSAAPDGVTATAPATVEPASAGTGSPAATAEPTATPTDPATPDKRLKPIEAALADPRIPGRPKTKRLGKLPGRPVKVTRWITDRRSRIAVPRLPGKWRAAQPKPFATRQVLPRAKGAGHRALLVSCPVPILVQERLKDTALLAARWSLNHQPKGATIKWVASQPRKVGKRDAWLIAYQVKYTVTGKKRTSMAAVLLTEVPKRKPALVFVSIPDSQKRYWRHINTIVSKVRAVK